MAAMVVCVQLATAVSVIPSEWVVRAGHEFIAQYIQLRGHGAAFWGRQSGFGLNAQYMNSLKHCMVLGCWGWQYCVGS